MLEPIVEEYDNTRSNYRKWSIYAMRYVRLNWLCVNMNWLQEWNITGTSKTTITAKIKRLFPSFESWGTVSSFFLQIASSPNSSLFPLFYLFIFSFGQLFYLLPTYYLISLCCLGHWTVQLGCPICITIPLEISEQLLRPKVTLMCSWFGPYYTSDDQYS